MVNVPFPEKGAYLLADPLKTSIIKNSDINAIHQPIKPPIQTASVTVHPIDTQRSSQIFVANNRSINNSLSASFNQLPPSGYQPSHSTANQKDILLLKEQLTAAYIVIDYLNEKVKSLTNQPRPADLRQPPTVKPAIQQTLPSGKIIESVMQHQVAYPSAQHSALVKKPAPNVVQAPQVSTPVPVAYHQPARSTIEKTIAFRKEMSTEANHQADKKVIRSNVIETGIMPKSVTARGDPVKPLPVTVKQPSIQTYQPPPVSTSLPKTSIASTMPLTTTPTQIASNVVHTKPTVIPIVQSDVRVNPLQMANINITGSSAKLENVILHGHPVPESKLLCTYDSQTFSQFNLVTKSEVSVDELQNTKKKEISGKDNFASENDTRNLTESNRRNLLFSTPDSKRSRSRSPPPGTTAGGNSMKLKEANSRIRYLADENDKLIGRLHKYKLTVEEMQKREIQFEKKITLAMQEKLEAEKKQKDALERIEEEHILVEQLCKELESIKNTKASQAAKELTREKNDQNINPNEESRNEDIIEEKKKKIKANPIPIPEEPEIISGQNEVIEAVVSEVKKKKKSKAKEEKQIEEVTENIGKEDVGISGGIIEQKEKKKKKKAEELIEQEVPVEQGVVEKKKKKKKQEDVAEPQEIEGELKEAKPKKKKKQKEE